MIARRVRGAMALLGAASVLLAGCGPGGRASAADPTATATTVSTAVPTTAPSSSGAVSTVSTTTVSTTTSSTTSAASAATPPPSAPDQGDVPGPEGTGRCAVDTRYTDEPATGLLPEVAAAWAAVLAEAAQVGVDVCLADGKRSRAQQQQIRDEYVRDYGEAMAEQYTLPPERSAHVTGTAVDVQPRAASNWLEGSAGRLGFCRTYDNEPWHFEFDATFAVTGCPARLPSPNG
ncbi:D-alanyl-D-alanine carboxypeptidase family protein [Nakamurella leprariae]|uniref:D-alanyl-D-alanine carboxypeptidase family protein n=1 Tax=Nakamurella leprariae TaxID=2803911 RepID=A0A938YDL4_9ACTN|nr:D-alanyl-D-alanine carboxypeptidase family protein [Nakamurella leprariae]MBM9465798.1 D-alanyl-D-alanine carboxypeptidase family protein [Nakamurella leprariae]